MPAQPRIRRKHTADKNLLWQNKKLPWIQHSGWETQTQGRGKAELWLVTWSEMIIGEFPDARTGTHLHTRRRRNKCLWTSAPLHCQRHHEIESFSLDDSMGYTILCAVFCHKLCRWVSPGAYSYLPSLWIKWMGMRTFIHVINIGNNIANNGTENTQLQAEKNISGRYFKFIIKELKEISAL